MQNSDFEIRLQTLAALGGDTSKTYDSVYSIDLEILRLTEQGGGGGGMTYDQIKAALAASGVTEIVFNDGESSVTLDYDLVSQIGQGGGGGDYICVDSVDALSGITSPKDGAMAYVKDKGLWQYYAESGVTKWLEREINVDNLTTGGTSELQTMCENFVAYGKPLTIHTKINDGASTGGDRLWTLEAGDGVGGERTMIYFWGSLHKSFETAGQYFVMYVDYERQNNVWKLKSRKTLRMTDELYTQMTTKLTNNGVNSIKFNSGSTSSITLDYDLVSQIGQGGGGNQEYICVNTVDELSGVTDPKDGMLAYVGAYDAQEEALVFSLDYYNTEGEWCRFIADYSGTTAKVQFNNNGRNINLEYGHFLRNNDGWFWDVPNNRSELPADFVFDNGVEGVLVSNTDGAEISEHNEYANTVMLYKYNGVLPTLTLDPEDVDYAVFVSSSVTTETVTRHYEAKGYYKYYADIQKWQPYQIYVENYGITELQTLFGDYTTYFKPLMAYFKDGADSSKDSWKIGVAHIYDNYDGNPEWKIAFTSVGREYWGNCSVFEIRYFRWNGEQWRKESSSKTEIPTYENITERIGRKIYTQSTNETDIYVGGLYSVGLNGTYSGVTISTTINFDASATSENHIATVYNEQNGRGMWEALCEDGWLFTQGMGMSATTNAEWFVFDYIVNSDTDTKFAAVKIEDNGDNTFTVTYFLTNDNWNSDSWDSEHYGRTDHYRFEYDNDRGYSWTVTEHQTLTVAPHLYTRICFTHKDNGNATYIHKYI